MGTIVILLLLVMTKLSGGHLIIAKEPPRFRLSYDDWKPVREGPIRHIRYPVYHKSNGYTFVPGKKVSQQAVDQSEKVEVFSPAPPTILGSFSVFGHATVNAREHASHMNKKPPRPHLTDFAMAESRPKVSSYKVRPQFIPNYSNYQQEQKRPQFNEFNEQSYFYEASLQPPPHESSKPFPHSSASSYYSYDQGQNFQTEKYRKTPKYPHSTYRYPPTVYSPQINEYKTTVAPTDYDATFSYYNNAGSNIDTEYYNENPIGAVPLSVRRPEPSLKPVTENNIHDQLAHVGKPFQNPETFTPVETIRGTLKPFGTFPSSTIETRVKFSDVAQPFRVSSYESGPISSSKPENIQETFTEEMYPLSVTTIDVPTESENQNGKETYDVYNSKSTPFKPSPYDPSNHRPYKNTFHDENNAPVFLPTPSTDVSPYLSEPKSEITTITPELPQDIQDSNFIPSLENKGVEPSEPPSDTYSTVPVENSTKFKPHRSRRPSRPTNTPTTSTSSIASIDNEFKYQRRRKPGNKYRNRGTTDKANTYKRQRTTSTTTPEAVEEDSYQYTTVPSDISLGNNDKEKYDYNEKYEYNGDKIEKPENREYYDEKTNQKYKDTEEGKINIVEAIPSSGDFSTSYTFQTTTSTTTTTAQPTTLPSSQTTTISAQTTTDTASRLKSKYGSRPRFSIKDYRDKLNKATSTVAPHETERTKPIKNETEFKFGGRTRGSTLRTTTTTTESPETPKPTSEAKFQKYKPRLGPSRYKTSTTQSPEVDTTTTERTNTFKPSGNRYKPGTGKYYSRYRTSTTPTKQVDESPATTTSKATVRPKGVFSAKRQPFPLKSKTETSKVENNESVEEEDEVNKYPESLKINENEVYSAVLKKMDDSTTTTISSEEEEDQEKKDIEKDPTGQESLRIADLTSSSSNDFHQSSLMKNGGISASRRPLPKITLPTDNPILPLEAFFQTHNN